MRFLSAVVTFASCINATPLIGQTLIQVPPVKVHTLKSKHVGDAFEIRVLLPPMISGEQTRFPVLYMTDVNGEFSTAGIMRLMMMADVPRFIAVGIGYPGAPDLMQAFAMRTRDLTPVVAAAEVPGSAKMPIEGMLKPTMTTGGGPRFLDFIRDELIPFIDSRYPTDQKDRGY